MAPITLAAISAFVTLRTSDTSPQEDIEDNSSILTYFLIAVVILVLCILVLASQVHQYSFSSPSTSDAASFTDERTPLLDGTVESHDNGHGDDGGTRRNDSEHDDGEDGQAGLLQGYQSHDNSGHDGHGISESGVSHQYRYDDDPGHDYPRAVDGGMLEATPTRDTHLVDDTAVRDQETAVRVVTYKRSSVSAGAACQTKTMSKSFSGGEGSDGDDSDINGIQPTQKVQEEELMVNPGSLDDEVISDDIISITTAFYSLSVTTENSQDDTNSGLDNAGHTYLDEAPSDDSYQSEILSSAKTVRVADRGVVVNDDCDQTPSKYGATQPTGDGYTISESSDDSSAFDDSAEDLDVQSHINVDAAVPDLNVPIIPRGHVYDIRCCYIPVAREMPQAQIRGGDAANMPYDGEYGDGNGDGDYDDEDSVSSAADSDEDARVRQAFPFIAYESETLIHDAESERLSSIAESELEEEGEEDDEDEVEAHSSQESIYAEEYWESNTDYS